MDFTHILSSAIHGISEIWWFFLIIVFILFLKSSFIKGFIGEFLTNLSVKSKLDKDKYHLLKNITLPSKDGTTQIDQIIISIYGIFVIETKNMKGWIFGNTHQKKWIQKIYKHESTFQNPLHQNYKHIKTIENILGVNIDKIFSIVIFMGDCTFKTEIPENVFIGSKFVSYILSKRKILFSEKEVNEMIVLLEKENLSNMHKISSSHKDHVQEIIKQKNNSNICPQCGSKLIIRVAKNGPHTGNKFYGCSSFPKCRYIKSIN